MRRTQMTKMRIADWIARKNNMTMIEDNLTITPGRIMKETQKAILIRDLYSDDNIIVWIPKSQLTEVA